MSRAPRPQGVVPGCDDRIPQRDGVLGRAHQLDALLAGVPGATDHHLDAENLTHRMGEGGRLGEAERRERRRPLHREERVLVGGVAHLRPGDLAFLQPAVGGLTVPGVHHEQRVERPQPVRDEVVDDPALLVREQRVLRVAVAQACEVVREQALEQLACLGPSTWSCPMCETSNTPRSRRTARCSGITPSYCTGMSQPAKGTMRAPSATWRS